MVAIQQTNFPVKLEFESSERCYIPTDTTSFITNRIPILSAFTGLHEDYHSPSDTADKLTTLPSQSALNYLQTLS